MSSPTVWARSCLPAWAVVSQLLPCRAAKAKQKAGRAAVPAWKNDTLEGLEKGSRVWFRASDTEWRLGTLTSVNAKVTTECIVALDAQQVGWTHRLPFSMGRTAECT